MMPAVTRCRVLSEASVSRRTATPAPVRKALCRDSRLRPSRASPTPTARKNATISVEEVSGSAISSMKCAIAHSTACASTSE
jgi:hypothetical protein